MASDDIEDLEWFDLLKLAGTFLLLCVAWGVFYSVVSLIVTTVQWIGEAFGWTASQYAFLPAMRNAATWDVKENPSYLRSAPCAVRFTPKLIAGLGLIALLRCFCHLLDQR